MFSGKTSLVDAMGRMAAIVRNSNNHQPGDRIVRFPHKLSDSSEPTSFELVFEKDGVKYSYGFKYGDEGVLEEYLYYWPSSKKSMVFERSSALDYVFAEPFKRSGENCAGRLKENKLLLSCAANETDITPILNVFLFFKNDLVFYSSGVDNWFGANCIAPGFIITEMTNQLSQEIKDQWAAQIPLRRGGTPEDVANVALFLASDLSSYVSGQVLHCCGAMNC